jgi:hypothetical protein
MDFLHIKTALLKTVFSLEKGSSKMHLNKNP